MLTCVALRTRLFLIATGLIILLVSALYAKEGFYKVSKYQDTKNLFTRIIIDDLGPHNPWGKSVGDINGDGLPDLIVGGNSPRGIAWYEKIFQKLGVFTLNVPTEELVWYENPWWNKHTISKGKQFSTDHEVIDVDGDGRNDVVTLTKNELLWYRNPNWSETLIDAQALHDVEVGDLDDDGDVDIVARGQSTFGGNGDKLYFYRQDSPTRWVKYVLSCPKGEGLKLADINRDGKPDVVVNGKWYANTGNLSQKGWPGQSYTDTWTWEDTYIGVGDINADGHVDIVLSPAEKAGETYRISWFESPGSPHTYWREHVVDAKVEADHHFIGTADMDRDGDLDIVSAEMHQGTDPDEVKIYLNQANGSIWKKKVLSRSGSHSLRIVDIDGDGDKDLFGANWSGKYQPVELWMNQTCEWVRHAIDDNRPWRAVFVSSGDIDRDGYDDIITGGWWYRNPGSIRDNWTRNTIGKHANNMTAVYDFDGDGDLDILATKGKEDPNSNAFVWARNAGDGSFEIMTNIPNGDGDFLQGVAVGQFISGESNIALSWHKSNKGIQIFAIPELPAPHHWALRKLSTVSQDEQLSAGDIDSDGDLDLLLGTRWLRNEGESWSDFVIFKTESNPDRNRLVDMNGDGRLDAVIGYEAISKTGKVAWYEQSTCPTDQWIEHVIGYCVGPMSLDVADMDQDGDLDVVVGEHNIAKPRDAKMLIFENLDGTATAWRKQLISIGDEHHDGAHVVDLDNDGDNDIVSIGWSHNKVIVYENKSGRCSH